MSALNVSARFRPTKYASWSRNAATCNEASRTIRSPKRRPRNNLRFHDDAGIEPSEIDPWRIARSRGEDLMGRECEVSGKKTSFGNHKTERGKAKYLGGVGKKTTGLSRRTFKPNLQWIHVWLPNGKTCYVRVATSVIRSGVLTLEVDGKLQTFPLIKASRGSAKARAELKGLYPI